MHHSQQSSKTTFSTSASIPTSNKSLRYNLWFTNSHTGPKYPYQQLGFRFAVLRSGLQFASDRSQQLPVIATAVGIFRQDLPPECASQARQGIHVDFEG